MKVREDHVAPLLASFLITPQALGTRGLLLRSYFVIHRCYYVTVFSLAQEPPKDEGVGRMGGHYTWGY